MVAQSHWATRSECPVLALCSLLRSSSVDAVAESVLLRYAVVAVRVML
jgi:hypothetical protein